MPYSHKALLRYLWGEWSKPVTAARVGVGPFSQHDIVFALVIRPAVHIAVRVQKRHEVQRGMLQRLTDPWSCGVGLDNPRCRFNYRSNCTPFPRVHAGQYQQAPVTLSFNKRQTDTRQSLKRAILLCDRRHVIVLYLTKLQSNLFNRSRIMIEYGCIG